MCVCLYGLITFKRSTHPSVVNHLVAYCIRTCWALTHSWYHVTPPVQYLLSCKCSQIWNTAPPHVNVKQNSWPAADLQSILSCCTRRHSIKYVYQGTFVLVNLYSQLYTLYNSVVKGNIPAFIWNNSNLQTLKGSCIHSSQVYDFSLWLSRDVHDKHYWSPWAHNNPQAGFDVGRLSMVPLWLDSWKGFWVGVPCPRRLPKPSRLTSSPWCGRFVRP